MEFKFKPGDIIIFTGTKPNDFHYRRSWFSKDYLAIPTSTIGMKFKIIKQYALTNPNIPTYLIEPLFETHISFERWLFPEGSFELTSDKLPTIF